MGDNKETLEEKVRWAQREDKGMDPLDFYREYHNGLTRGQLIKEDSGLYQRLWKDKLLEHIPKGKTGGPRKNEDFCKYPLTYYRKYYGDLTQGELKMRNKKLYKALIREGLMGQIPRYHSDYVDDPKAYYKDHYAGLSIYQILPNDIEFYLHLTQNNLVEEVTGRKEDSKFRIILL
tara:strand:- start:561 stop:1088 length:528 start_codon:yes stop_codon:yes gene_type:complete